MGKVPNDPNPTITRPGHNTQGDSTNASGKLPSVARQKNRYIPMRARNTPNSGANRCMFPWVHAHVAETEAIMGKDPWAYGLTEQNRKTLDTMVGYSHEQGLIKRRIPLDELFLDVGQGHKRGGFKI